jgi:hypothetical protein
MRKYFYNDGKEKFGPFTLDELKEQNLSRDTKVWFYGLNNWEPLSDIEELSSLINSIPPPLKISESEMVNTDNSNYKKNDLLEKVDDSKKPKRKMV